MNKKIQPNMKRLRASALIASATFIGASALAQDGFVTSIKPYTVPVGGEYQVVPILSVGDKVPETSDPSKQYQMVGIPDGLGAYANPDGTVSVLMNHELTKNTTSQPVIGGPLNRGALISRFILAQDGSVLSGERAYDTVFDHFAGTSFPAADSTNGSRAFSRFCSASIAGPDGGFDRPIYLAGEESGGADTFDGRGGQLTATFDNQIHTLKKFPRIPWENALPRPVRRERGRRHEHGRRPRHARFAALHVCRQKRTARRLQRAQPQRLDNGKVYAFRSKDPSRNSENTFLYGSIIGEWVEIPNVENLHRRAARGGVRFAQCVRLHPHRRRRLEQEPRARITTSAQPAMQPARQQARPPLSPRA
jgi:hypothetical protein